MSITFTKDGFEKLQQELQQLTAERPHAVLDLKKARELGDLSENGYYKAARAKLSQIDRKLRELNYVIKNASIANSTQANVVGITSTVTITNNKQTLTLTIVGDREANPTEGKISSFSPFGKALMGKKQGENVVVETPQGKSTYTIVSVS